MMNKRICCLIPQPQDHSLIELLANKNGLKMKKASQGFCSVCSSKSENCSRLQQSRGQSVSKSVKCESRVTAEVHCCSVIWGDFLGVENVNIYFCKFLIIYAVRNSVDTGCNVQHGDCARLATGFWFCYQNNACMYLHSLNICYT